MHASDPKRDDKRDAQYQRAKTFNGLTAREWTLLSRNVWNDVSSPRHDRHLKHGAVFPVKLADRLIRIYSREGDHVVDPFLGIGSTCVAALRSGRCSSGVELSEEFFNVAHEWIEDECAQNELHNGMRPRIYHGDALALINDKFADVELTVTSPVCKLY